MDTNLEVMQKTGVAIRENIDEVEKLMLEKDQVECDVQHYFFPGMYIREVSIPKGTLALGHYHKTKHLNIFLKGKATFIDDKGEASTIEAPMMFMSKPGRKIAYAVETMVWQNIFLTEETSIEKLEEALLDKSDYFLSLQERSKLCQQ